MTRILLFAAIFFANCSSSKKDNATVANNTTETSVSAVANDINKLPPCIKKLIDSFKTQPVQNPPRSIYSYRYKGETVYYISAPCCDNFSELLDSHCKLIAHPDGGFSGRGDGKMPDFRQVRTDEKLVWKDKRQ